MHTPYNVLVISAIVFGFAELALALASFTAMKNLKLKRITHWLNDQGQELDKDGKPIVQSAGLKRVFGLAKPVRPKQERVFYLQQWTTRTNMNQQKAYITFRKFTVITCTTATAEPSGSLVYDVLYHVSMIASLSCK